MVERAIGDLRHAFIEGARDAFSKFANLPTELLAEALTEKVAPPTVPVVEESTPLDHLNALATESTQHHVGPLSVIRRLFGH